MCDVCAVTDQPATGIGDDVRDRVSTFDGLSPPYRTIVADPPWNYNKSVKSKTRTGGRGAQAEHHYSTMTMPEIAALPVESIADDEAHLYLWVTNPRIIGDRNDGSVTPFDIVEAWGFRYITLITWIKTGAPGPGWYFRGNTEHVIFAVRGGLGIPSDKRVPNWFEASKGGHSQKPAAFLDIVEQVSPGPYVELFCRQPRFGWDTWGHGFEVAS